MGGKKDTGQDAAGAQAAANQQGIQVLKRQFKKTKQNVNPFIEAGLGALGDVSFGSTLEGFSQRLQELFSGGALDPLIDERTEAATNQQAAVGLTRSGAGLREIADIPTQLGLMIENLLFGRSGGLAGQGLNAALNLGSLGQGQAAGIAGLAGNTGQAVSSGIVTDAQAKAAGIEQGIGALSGFLPTLSSFIGGGAGAASGGSVLTGALPVIASFFSDPNLKENVEEIGEFIFADKSKNLKIYQWDWIPEAEDTIVSIYPKIGFMADEVKENYPEFIQRYAGFDMILYKDLLDRLEVQNELKEAA